MRAASRQAPRFQMSVHRAAGPNNDLPRRSRCARTAAHSAPVAALPQGIRRNTCPQKWTSSHPAGSPRPAISPRSLILVASNNSRLELAGIKVFRSTMDPLFHRTARKVLVSQLNDAPTIWSLELIVDALLKQSPGNVPRSLITPFFQRVAWNDSSFGVL